MSEYNYVEVISQVMLMAYQSAATCKSVLYQNSAHQYIHTYGRLWYINGCIHVHLYTCTGVYMERVHM